MGKMDRVRAIGRLFSRPAETQTPPAETNRFHIYDLDIEAPLELITPPIRQGLEKGWYERDEVEIARSRLVPGDRVVELGAGLGVTALVAARIVGAENVRAFEANPGLIAVERANGALNGLPVRFENRVLMSRASLPSQGTVPFLVAEEFWASELRDGPGSIAVPAGALEDVLAEFGANTLIMDIEGAEIDIIENVDLSAINKFIFEIHYENQGIERTDAAIEKLQRSGCRVDYKMCSRGVVYLERK